MTILTNEKKEADKDFLYLYLNCYKYKDYRNKTGLSNTEITKKIRIILQRYNASSKAEVLLGALKAGDINKGKLEKRVFENYPFLSKY